MILLLKILFLNFANILYKLNCAEKKKKKLDFKFLKVHKKVKKFKETNVHITNTHFQFQHRKPPVCS